MTVISLVSVAATMIYKKFINECPKTNEFIVLDSEGNKQEKVKN